MQYNTLVMVLQTDRPIQETPSQLRGYIGNKFKEHPILHHHIQDLGYLFMYPKVQYKILAGNAYILGIEEGATALKEISSALEELHLGKSWYNLQEKVFYEKKVRLGPSSYPLQYKFLTPWLALNPQNYKNYLQIADWKAKKEFLNNIIIGNILSMCKGLGFQVNSDLHAHSRIDYVPIEFKNIPFTGFQGEFQVNFEIPDYFGLGKGVSQGFGVVHPISNCLET